MNTKEILIIDGDKHRIKGIINSFSTTESDLDIYRFYDNELSLYHQEKGFIQPDKKPQNYLMVLRHGRNAKFEACNGAVNICYSGAGGVDEDILKGEKNFYPKVNHDGIKLNDCKELLNYALKIKDGVSAKEPECIYPRKALNEKIVEQYNTLVNTFTSPEQIQENKTNDKAKGILVLWNPFIEIENKSNYYRHNVINKRTFAHCSYIDSDKEKFTFHVIDSFEDLLSKDDEINKEFIFEDKKELSINDFEEIHILIELNWTKKKGRYRYADLLGLNLATKLIYDRVTSPIILFSTLPRQEFIQLKNEGHADLNLEVFDVLGSNLVCLCQENYEFDLLFPKKYSDYTLNEMIYYGLKPEGRIANILHSFSSSPEKIEFWFKQLGLIIPVDQYEKLALYKNQIKELINTKSDIEFKEELRRIYREKIIRLIPNSESGINEVKEKVEKPWHVLVVEDQFKSMEKTCHLIEKNGIYCSRAKSSNEALAILKKDKNGLLSREYKLVYDENERIFKKIISKKEKFPVNHITVIICDIRLVDEDGLWNGLQGFELIHRLVYNQKNSNNLSYFILTEKEEGLSNIIQGNTYIRIHEFLKTQIDERRGKPALFLSILKREGTFIYDGKLYDLGVGNWNKARTGHFKWPVRKYYEWHRGNNYAQNEIMINDKALELIKLAVLFNKENENKDRIVEEGNFPRRLGRMLGDPGEEKSMENLYDRLICRRIVIGLLGKKLEKVKILSLFKNKGYFGENVQIRKEFERDFKNSLFFKDLSWEYILKNIEYLLPEESLFIKNNFVNHEEFLKQEFFDDMGVISKRIHSKATFKLLDAIEYAKVQHNNILDKVRKQAYYFYTTDELKTYIESVINIMDNSGLARSKIKAYRSGSSKTLYDQLNSLFEEYENTINKLQVSDLLKRFLEALRQ